MSSKKHITYELKAFAHKFAVEANVTAELHESDFIFQFLINNPVFQEKAHAVRYYFEDGLKSAKKLNHLIREYSSDPITHHKTLEFASGYGCVTRHFKNHLPYVKSVSCDIHPAAVEFIQNKIGRTAILSSTLPENFKTDNDFDVVFALSFFSHMPSATWQRWLSVLYNCLKPGGLLIFTTQGTETAKKFMGNPEIPKDGFYFLPQSEQHDISTDEYGQTIVTEAFVQKALRSIPSVTLLKFIPSYWWEHQDTWIIKREI